MLTKSASIAIAVVLIVIVLIIIIAYCYYPSSGYETCDPRDVKESRSRRHNKSGKDSPVVSSPPTDGTQWEEWQNLRKKAAVKSAAEDN